MLQIVVDRWKDGDHWRQLVRTLTHMHDYTCACTYTCTPILYACVHFSMSYLALSCGCVVNGNVAMTACWVSLAPSPTLGGFISQARCKFWVCHIPCFSQCKLFFPSPLSIAVYIYMYIYNYTCTFLTILCASVLYTLCTHTMYNVLVQEVPLDVSVVD